MSDITDQQSLHDEIAELERRLRDARTKLNPSAESAIAPAPVVNNDSLSALHALLLLADSALPLGSFAFSSGLESYLAHHKPPPSTTSFAHSAAASAAQLPAFESFLKLSLATLASTSLPYVLAGYRQPQHIENWDNDFDASTPCTVARRASVAQGRALLAVWERSFREQYACTPTGAGSAASDGENADDTAAARAALHAFSHLLRTSAPGDPYGAHAHLAPLWGVVTSVLRVPLRDAAYLFLFSHARTVVSAAVRASVMGPYQAQGVLAGAELQERIRGLVDEGWGRGVEDAGQCVPVMDLWVGRHEKLYSRIFNS